jgi:hypothetical protein
MEKENREEKKRKIKGTEGKEVPFSSHCLPFFSSSLA